MRLCRCIFGSKTRRFENEFMCPEPKFPTCDKFYELLPYKLFIE